MSLSSYPEGPIEEDLSLFSYKCGNGFSKLCTLGRVDLFFKLNILTLTYFYREMTQNHEVCRSTSNFNGFPDYTSDAYHTFINCARISVTRQFLVSLTSIVRKNIMEVNETRNCLVTDILLNIRKSAEWIQKR